MIQPPGQPKDPASAGSLAPPRPNLGPEPMGADDSLAQLAISLMLGGVILAALMVLWRRWRAQRIFDRPKPSVDDSSEARLLALRERARTILAARFGPALRARTTEEIAADARVAEALGGDDLARLMGLFRAGDRVLFDRDSGLEPHGDPSSELAAWSALLDALSRAR